MLAMDAGFALFRPRGIAFAWLAAAAMIPLVLILAVLGQAVGAMLGGCTWIGGSLPADHQVWALVNQPTGDGLASAFASQRRATGYWLGSMLLPLAVAALAVPILPRSRSLAAELVVVQLAWTAATVGVAWMPLLDAKDGHLSAWLELHRLPPLLVWSLPLLAAAAALSPCLRLLALARRLRSHISRWQRLGVVVLYLLPPLAGWVCLAALVRGELPVRSLIGILVPSLVAVATAWLTSPPPYVQPLEELEGGSFAWAIAAVLVLGSLVAVAGWPLADSRRTGLLWSHPSSANNVRPWIRAIPVTQLLRGVKPADTTPR